MNIYYCWIPYVPKMWSLYCNFSLYADIVKSIDWGKLFAALHIGILSIVSVHLNELMDSLFYLILHYNQAQEQVEQKRIIHVRSLLQHEL